MPPRSAPAGDPLDLVLLHGWGMNAAVWDPLAALLAPHARIHSLDLPGHGTHPFAPQHRDLTAWADACLDAAPATALWLGWSLGGLVALCAALRAPARLEGLILLGATPRFTRAVDWTPAMPSETLAHFHTSLRTDPTTTIARFLALQLRGGAAERETLRALRREVAAWPQPDERALSLGLDLLREEDLRGRLPDIRCPSLWLFGTHDTLVPSVVAERVASLMPGTTSALIPGAAHAPHLSHPEETARQLGTFMSRIAHQTKPMPTQQTGE
ncbi:pimeloyl-[acyl-carrier protein] methyl ester esterase [Thiocapsa imhoffii]|uniref:Pimeloyl-[acyl-carrier protein] methyl ester esterase n=1 Tax=Thiocapsa imhoffii TaxID=382777 RepID=A0A9X0WIY6_9GAMM|nr:pimeloyl-ACP methyl ester esterase BioH [Thiocapsa imhoffii]MBK1645416.1 pimeloyl-[acyl-carrier protein] methyl ester esterase [Thiocapsa imhoffii]